MEHWRHALESFLDEWIDASAIRGILVCGSYVTGDPDSHSDIDVHLVLSSSASWRERGNRLIDGFLIEYFANPPAQIRSYFQEDYHNHDRQAATQFATGLILDDRDGIVRELQVEAERWLLKPFSKPGKDDIELIKYGVWDRLDNLQAAWDQMAPDFVYLYHDTIRRLYEAYARFQCQPVTDLSKSWVCLFKPEKAQNKYRMDPFPDELFLNFLRTAVSETEQSQMLPHAETLTAYVLDKMDGFEIDGWKFRSQARF